VKLFKPKTIRWPTWQGWALLSLILAGFFIVFFLNAHRFLAVTNRVAGADVLVIEDWLADVFVQAAAMEFKEGNYRLLLISGIREFNDQDNRPQNVPKSSVVNRVVSLGVPRNRIIECFAPATDSHRSAARARSASNALRQNCIISKGVNVLAPATHARKTWLVYRRALGTEVPVGIIAVVPGVYDPAWWWMNSQSAKWVITNYAGLFHEWITGL
jgi:hypothetical protein